MMQNREVLALVEASRLWGRGLGAVDARLLAAALVTPGAVLWTRDRGLAAAAAERHVAFDAG